MCTDGDPRPRQRELETAQILLPVCVTSCSTTSTEVTTDERTRGFFHSKLRNLILSPFFFFLGSLLEPNASKTGLLVSWQEKWWTHTSRWHALPALRFPGKSGRTVDLDHLLFAEQRTDEMISSNKWVGLNFPSIYLFCPHFFSFGLACQSTLPWWWIYEGLGKLELNTCIFCKLRHHIKGNSKSSVNSYQPTFVCFSVQLSKCAMSCVLK